MNMQPLFRRLLGAAEIVLALLLGSMFAAFLTQIFFRYILNHPLGWTIEYVAIAWMWGILFGYAFVVRDDEIIRMDIVYRAVPERMRRVMDVVAQTACALILLWSLPKTIGYIDFMKIEQSAYLRISFNLLFSIYVPFAVAVSARCLWTAWKALTGRPVASHTPATGMDVDART